jgi:ABC-type nitrate/sulfonate/bicarbonate transport system substrate-binding protein
MTTTRRRAWLLGAALAVSLVSLASGVGALAPAAGASARPTPVQILLDWYPNTDHTGLYAAVARGYFRAAGVVPQISVPSNPDAALEEVAAGKVDFAISYEPDVLLARAKGIPVLSVMALVDRPLNTILSLAQSHITTAADLRGKTIGITGLPSDHAVVSAVLQYGHVPPATVKVVNVGYNLLPALLHHRVDAVEGVYWTWEAVQLQLQGYKTHVLHLEQVGVPTYDELVLVTSDHLAQSDPALVRKVVDAIQRGYAFAAAHPTLAGQELLQETRGQGLSPGLVRASLRLLAPAFDSGVPTVGYESPAAWTRYMRWMVAHHLLAHAVPADQALTNRFLLPHVGGARGG